MSAKIIQLSGRSEVAVFWIDEAVVSIGSSPGCSIRISELEPEACILQYCDGNYYVHHRGSQAIHVASQRLEPGQAIIWEDGEKMRLNGLVTIQLAADGPPEPKRLQDAEEVVCDNNGDSTSARRTNIQLAAISVCVVAAVTLFLSAGSKAVDHGSSVAFEMLTTGLLAERAATDSASRSLLETLQQARYHELRNDPKIAVMLYGKARDELYNKSDATLVVSAQLGDQVRSFVGQRLDILSR